MSKSFRSVVNITGLSHGAIVAALFNAAWPIGYGLHKHGLEPTFLTASEATQLLDRVRVQSTNLTHVNYHLGRPLKVTLRPGVTELDATRYDGYFGEGHAQRVIDILRRTNNVCAPAIVRLHDIGLTWVATPPHNEISS